MNRFLATDSRCVTPDRLRRMLLCGRCHPTDVVLDRTLTKMIVVILLILQGTLAQLSGKQHGALMALYDALGTQHRTGRCRR
jgi:hypothetical protein